MSTKEVEAKPQDLSVAKSQIFEDGELLRKMYEIIEKAQFMTKDSPERVANFLHPKELEEKFDFQLHQDGIKRMEEFEEIIESVMHYSVKTTHARFYNNLYTRTDEVGLAGAWLLEALNVNIPTYDVAPVFVTMELHMIQVLVKLFGWKDGDGLFAPGGSASNINAIALAIHKKYPNLKKEGLYGKKPLAILTSDMCHYSMEKGASFLGIGNANVSYVESDANGKMKGEALRMAIKQARAEGKDPFFVNATAGTTVLGAFDQFDEVADVCQEEGLWLHVDACWGGAAVFSPRKKYLLKGVERADSISWNAHKMIGAPVQCSAFMVKHKGLLSSCNGSTGSYYLFQPDKCYDVSYDTGDKSIQCGRKGDVLKLWLMLKFRGMKEFGDRVDAAFAAAKYLEDSVRNRPGFRLVLDKHQCTNICFWYIPPSLQGLEENEEWKQKLQKVAPAIIKRIIESGSLMVAYQPIPTKNIPNFFRMVVTCFPIKTNQDMDFLLDEIEKYGKDM